MTINAQSTTAQAVAAAVQSNPQFNPRLADALLSTGKLSADEIKTYLAVDAEPRIRAGWAKAAAAANARFGL